MFVPRDSVEWIWYDKPHYLTPADPVAEEAYSVIREAMKATDMVGISRVVLYRRERAVMLEPRDNGIVLWTLRYGDEVRDEDEYFGDIKTRKSSRGLKSLVNKLIQERTREVGPGDGPRSGSERAQGHYRRKDETRRQSPRSQESRTDRPNNVVNIMDALKKSLAAETKKAPPR